jgi:hypothetical protein
MEAFKKLNIKNNVDGKLLVLNSVQLDETCKLIYLSKTINVSTFIHASDRCGFEISIQFKKESGSIRLSYRRKRCNNTGVEFFDEENSSIFHQANKADYFKQALHYIDSSKCYNTLLIQSLLTELPTVLSRFIQEQYTLKGSKSWEALKNFACSVISCENKYFKTSVHISTSNEHEHLIYNYIECTYWWDEAEAVAALLNP